MRISPPRPRQDRRRRADHRRTQPLIGPIERLEARQLLATFQVTNTLDSGPGSLRQAILDANQRQGPDFIAFEIPASTAPNLDIPVAGFDPVTQTWRIALESPLPTVTDQLTIDAYTQAHFPIPYRYPDKVSQSVLVSASTTGGTFTLTTTAPLPGNPTRTTAPIPYDATAAQVLAALNDVLGVGNVFLSGGDANVAPIFVSFVGEYIRRGLGVPDLIADGSGLIGGGVNVTKSGDIPLITIASSASTVGPQVGNSAVPRVLLDGSNIDRGAHTDPIGFELAVPHTIIRGFGIEGFEIGVVVGPLDASPMDAEGVLIQGNFIGAYPLFPVNPHDGQPVEGAAQVVFGGLGNDAQGVVINATNATIGGTAPQDQNAIANNGAEGVWIVRGAQGNQVVGNQIGVVGPTQSDYYAQLGNGGDGILIESAINAIGGSAPGAGNVISANQGHGVRIRGVEAARNRMEGNYIGVAPGGGFRFGSGDPGNRGDGVRIENAPWNTLAGTAGPGTNVISANEGAGVHITGASATGIELRNNLIGLVADGKSVLGNSGPGVRITTAANTVGAGNVISGNLRGVHIGGAGAAGNTIENSFIGTDVTGAIDLGNALEGVLIQGAPNTRVLGDGAGSQLISGNDVGLAIDGALASGSLVRGNWIGLDATGTIPIGNSKEGLRIGGAPDGTIGGTTAAAGNTIVGNRWGVVIRGSDAVGNLLAGNTIRGSELHGLLIRDGASRNTVSGITTLAPSAITDNLGTGVLVESGDFNTIESTAIWGNGGLGIDLIGTANRQVQAPVITAAVARGSILSVQGTVTGLPNADYAIELFASVIPDPSGFGEGETVLGRTNARTDENGQGTFAVEFEADPQPIWFLTATATDPAGNTSEFSRAVNTGTAAVQFAAASIEVDENAGAARVTVTRTGVLGGSASVAYATVDGSAVAGTDFTQVAGRLIFLPGQAEATFSIPITNDNAIEGDESFQVVLSDPSDAASLGAISTATVTIHDDDKPAAGFTLSSYTVTEGGTATITLTRSGGLGTSASVAYALVAGSAVAGRDFVPATGRVTFAPGQDRASFTIRTSDDDVVESDETFRVVLSDPVGLDLGDTTSATVTIRDNDRPGTIQFALMQYTVKESDGAAFILVTRTGGASGHVSVVYGLAAADATPGVDYEPVRGTLDFAPGETAKVIIVPIHNDHEVEGDESIYMAIGFPTGGATIGSQSVSVLTIRNDDFDVTPPTIVSVDPILNGSSLIGLSVAFSEPLDPSRAADLFNYDAEILSAGRDGRFGTVDDRATPLQAAVYEAGTNRVILMPASPLPLNMMHRIQINRFLVPRAGAGVADRAGNLLDGDGDGLPGGAFVAELGIGGQIAFYEADGDFAQLSLSNGLLDVRKVPGGPVTQVRVLRSVPGSSRLTGLARWARRSDRRVLLPPIQDAQGVDNRLPVSFRAGGTAATPSPIVAPIARRRFPGWR